ncbi:MAG: universal stress protein [Vicinamibacteria bacterium]
MLAVARERKVDLIAMGVRGRNPLDIMLFGSTTQHVVRHAECPVLTISEGD